MEYSIQYHEDQGLVVATATGAWDSQGDNTMVGEIMQTANDAREKKVLIDLRELQFDLPIVHMFERAQELREKRREFESRSVKVAIVYRSKNEMMDEDMKFFENAAKNRGLPYRVFKDMDLAISWLDESES